MAVGYLISKQISDWWDINHNSDLMKRTLTLLALALLVTLSTALLTSSMAKRRFKKAETEDIEIKATPQLQTSCKQVNLASAYNYNGIAGSGYLSVSKNNSALGYIFYGQKDVRSVSQLKNYPTVLWLNGGPGSSSQLGNFQEMGPIQIKREIDVVIKENKYTWANKYNLLFIDQPVGTGLSYADDSNGAHPYVHSMDDVANDFYKALYELYKGNGCFNSQHFDIPPSNHLVIFGESYAGKYVPAIAKKIRENMDNGGFLTGLKGIAIGDGFTYPYQILSEVGTYAYHLGLNDFQERAKVEKMLINASRHNDNHEWDLMHDDFDNTLDYIVEQAGDVNVYDIKIDGEYEQLVEPYFRDTKNLDLWGFSHDVKYGHQAEKVYENLYTDFMMPETSRVEYLLSHNVPVLVYNGQDDLIVQTPGTLKWVDNINYDKSAQFRSKLFSAWKINGKMAGSMKAAGNLELRIVNNAGHLVPMDRPEEALDMATSFVDRVTK